MNGLTEKLICQYAAEHGFSAAYCFPPQPSDGAPENIKTLVLLTREYAPGGWLVDHFYPASNAAYHEARRMAERISGDLGVLAVPLGNLRMKPMCRRHPAFGTGRNTLNYLPGIGSRFCMELIGLSVSVPISPSTAFDDARLNCRDCSRCAQACPSGAITDSGFQKERCIRFHMMGGSPMPEAMRQYVGANGGTYGIIGCDLCQRVCPANAGKEKQRTEDDAFTLDQLLICDPDTLTRFADLYGKNYAIRNRIVAQALLAASNGGREDMDDVTEKLKNHSSALVKEYARWAQDRSQKKE